MRSLRMKMVMIMVILILALMLTTGAFLMSGVGNFYVSQFYEQMEETFTPEFIVQLQRLSEEDNAPAQMKALLMAQAGLGIDITGRNVYILDQTGSVLDSSNQKTSVAMTQNILSAANAVIQNNEGRKGKNLWTESEDGEKLLVKEVYSQTEEAMFIADSILERVAQGEKLSSFAVLYRTNAQSAAIEEALL